MKELFEQYGGTIVTVIAITSLIAIVKLLLGQDENSVIYQAFSELLKNFYTSATALKS